MAVNSEKSRTFVALNLIGYADKNNIDFTVRYKNEWSARKQDGNNLIGYAP